MEGRLRAMSYVLTPEPDLIPYIEGFFLNRRQDLRDCFAALENQDLRSIRRFAHTWKGIARPYGFVDLEGFSQQLEVAATTTSVETTMAWLSKIDDYLNKVEPAVRELSRLKSS